MLVIAAVLIASIAGLVGLVHRGRTRPQAVSPEAVLGSVAVLPLVNSGGDPSLEYLSDGVTEHLIARLSSTPGLRVIARDSVFRYRDTGHDPIAIGRKLGVRAVLTGSITHRHRDVVVTAQVEDVRDGRRVWSARYDRRLADLQFLENELAEDIAVGLRLQLRGQARARFLQTYTRSSAAYQLYLQGRYFWNRRTPADLRKSADYFRQATEADPQFALAWAGLADSLGLLTEYHALPARETYVEARRAAERALELDPQLCEAHTSLAYVRHFYERDWQGAERAFRNAIELNPQYPTAHQWYAELLTSRGRVDAALMEIRRARDPDPVSLIVNSVEAHILYMARRYDEAIEQCRRVIDLDPNFPETYEYLKRAYEQKGMYREAIAARQTRRRLLGLDVTETDALRAAASATSPRVYWRSRVTQELAEARTEGLPPFEFAELLAQAGDTMAAFTWLDKACDEHDFDMLYTAVTPTLDSLRSEPRFTEILQRHCGLD